MINVYIDSNVFVASELEEEQNHTESKRFMDYVLKAKHLEMTFSTYVFTFLELASAMIRRTKNKDRAYSLLYQIRSSWKDAIKPLGPLPTSKHASFTRLVDTLIETSIAFCTPSGDTIHAQTVARYDLDYLITWNKDHFSEMQTQFKNLKILNPKEALEAFGKQ
jgi:predicted nucleic acid-binding protein